MKVEVRTEIISPWGDVFVATSSSEPTFSVMAIGFHAEEPPKPTPPRSEADRLGEISHNAGMIRRDGEIRTTWSDMSATQRLCYQAAALAVRDAVLDESPTVEECNAAHRAWMAYSGILIIDALPAMLSAAFDARKERK